MGKSWVLKITSSHMDNNYCLISINNGSKRRWGKKIQTWKHAKIEFGGTFPWLSNLGKVNCTIHFTPKIYIFILACACIWKLYMRCCYMLIAVGWEGYIIARIKLDGYLWGKRTLLNHSVKCGNIRVNETVMR